MTMEFLSPTLRSTRSQNSFSSAHERSGGLAMRDDVAESAARLHHLRRQTVHLNIALVADDEPLRSVEQQQAPGSCWLTAVVQALLFPAFSRLLRQQMLLRQLANHQKQHGCQSRR